MAGIFGWFRFGSSGRGKEGSESAPWEDRQALYDHIARMRDVSTGLLLPDGECLPDEPDPSQQELRFMAGTLDGAFAHYGSPGRNKRQAARLYKAIKRAARKRTPEALQSLQRLLSDEGAIEVIDPLLDRITERDGIDPERLLSLGKWLATRAPDREIVKVAMALLGLVQDREAREILTTLSMHEEFTLYGAVALAKTAPDPDQVLWNLARSVEGWGRVHIVERLAGTTDPKIKAWLLREGYRNTVLLGYTAHVCAVTGELAKALQAADPDDALIQGACAIIEALIDGERGPAAGILDYDDAPAALNALIPILSKRQLNLHQLGTVALIRRFLSDSSTAQIEDGSDHRWNARSLESACEAILSNPDWKARIIEGLQSRDRTQFLAASQVAEDMDVDAWPFYFARMEQPGDDDAWLWFQLSRTKDPERFLQVIDLATTTLPLNDIASGPDTLLGLGGEHHAHQNLDSVIQQLHRFPGEGWELIRTGLQSPVVRNRFQALNALGSWGKSRWNDSVEPSLKSALEREPDPEVRVRIKKVMGGEILETP